MMKQRITPKQWAIIVACSLTGAVWLGMSFGIVLAFVGAVCGAGGGALAGLLENALDRNARI
jgi:drug/metabolite transporter (DMT)-like permease